MNTDTTFLDCGCSFTTGLVDGEQVMVVQACDNADCPNLAMFYEVAREQGKPTITRSRDTITVTCPRCLRVNDGVMPVSGEAVLPDPGSLSICFYCATVNIYERNPDGDLYLRAPTDEEADDIAADDDVMRAVAVVEQSIERRD